jgi:hypothetical protein
MDARVREFLRKVPTEFCNDEKALTRGDMVRILRRMIDTWDGTTHERFAVINILQCVLFVFTGESPNF